jgi:phosphoserine phosphatase RsbU/P
MKLTRWIRKEDLERTVQELEGIFRLELSVVGSEGDILAGRLLPRSRAGIEEAPIAVNGVPAATLRCGGTSLEPGAVGRAAQFIAALLEREAATQRNTRDLLGSLAHTWKELHFLYEMSASLRVTMGLQETCELILEQLVKLMDVQRASILLFGEDGQLYIQAARGIPVEVVSRTRIRVGDGVAGWVAQHERPLLVEDVRVPPAELAELIGKQAITQSRSFLSVPLHTGVGVRGGDPAGGRLMGVLNLTDRRSDVPFTPEDLNLVSAVGAQAAIAIENALLAHRASFADKLDLEMEAASRLQQALLPRTGPVFEGLDVWAQGEPGASVARHYYDFLGGTAERFRAVLAEGSVGGISGALLMSTVRASVRALCSLELAPAEVASRLNRLLCDDLSGTGLFTTVFFLQYDTAGRQMRYASAGFGPQLVCRASGEIELLGGAGMAAGVVAEAAYDEPSLELQAGDVVALFTDALVHMSLPDGVPLGLDRLAELLAKHRHLPARQLARAVLTEAAELRRGAAAEALPTLVVLKVAEPSA